MRGDRIRVACKICDRPFDTPYALAEICDWVCRSEHRTRQAQRRKGLPPRDTVRQECEWCGDDFFGVQGQARCSEACREETT